MTIATPEIRWDPFTGDGTTLIRRERESRRRMTSPDLPLGTTPCPFCPETFGPAAIQEWNVPFRIVAFRNEMPRADMRADVNVHGSRGNHEVIVDSPRHDCDLGDMPSADLAAVLQAYRERARRMEYAQDIQLVTLFRNVGRWAGASQPHPHGQLLGFTYLTPQIERAAFQATEHFSRHGSRLVDDVAKKAVAEKERLVFATDHFVVATPWAPRVTHEIHLMPCTPEGSFAESGDADLTDLACCLHKVFFAMRAIRGPTGYNLVMRHLPKQLGDRERFWYLSVLPRRSGLAGAALATGLWAAMETPESVAEQYRSALRGYRAV